MSALEPLPPTDALQQQPAEPPLAKLHIPDGIPVPPNVALPSNATVWTKLYLLLHAHQLARSAARMVLLLRLLVLAFAITLGIASGILIGIGVYWLCYDDPSQRAQEYREWGGGYTWYVRGQKVSQQEYDYYLKNSNERTALAVSIPLGIIAGVLTGVLVCVLLGPRKPTVYATIEEQIAAIAKEHPEAVAAWGGVAVLRVPQLIERLLDMQSKDARR